jgi:hypothetical protein
MFSNRVGASASNTTAPTGVAMDGASRDTAASSVSTAFRSGPSPSPTTSSGPSSSSRSSRDSRRDLVIASSRGSLGCAPSTVTRQSARFGRHALLLTATALAELDAVDERLVIDHFESFVRTQDYPVGVATVVGRGSWFIYGLDPAPHKRTGTRSSFQEAKRKARAPQATKGGYTGSMVRVLDSLLHFFPENPTIGLTTDGMTAYTDALRQRRFVGRFEHRACPNPKRGPKGSPRSPEAIRRDNAMFPVDTLHKLLRHSECHHRRETIAFGRRTNAILERLYLAAVWRNFVKKVTERSPVKVTPAMRVGLAVEPWTWRRVLARRLFPGRVLLPKSWIDLYKRAWITPGGPNCPHEKALAY